MKKLLIVLFSFALLFGSANVVKSQTANGYVSFAGATVTNTQTVYLAVTAPLALTRNYVVTMLVVPVNGTGTPTVTAMPQYSLDGTNYYDLQSGADTVNNAGTVAVKSYLYPDAYGRYYRVKLVGTNTGTTTTSGKLGIKYPQ